MGIPTFNDQKPSSAGDLLVSDLDTIDLHHGSYSASPPYTIPEVLGAPLSDRIKAELSHYGFDEFHPNSEGFCTCDQCFHISTPAELVLAKAMSPSSHRGQASRPSARAEV
jgi:hypothetical protein